jgi:hypothetical protein
MVAYSSRYWRYDGQKWIDEEAFSTSLPAVQVSNDPDVPPEIYQINLFKEYSVAASEWVLYLPMETREGRKILDMETITDIEIHFYYYWYARNLPELKQNES